MNIYNEYDARGWLTKQSDNRGRSMMVERDASGAPVAYNRGDGKRLILVRDETSRVVAMTDFNGLTRRYVYDARGAVTDYTNTQGKHYRYEYDKRGLLRSIIKADGTRTTIERDERGRVLRLASTLKSATQFTTLAHALMPQDDGSGYVGDTLTIDIWAPRWTDYPVNGGSFIAGGVSIIEVIKVWGLMILIVANLLLLLESLIPGGPKKWSAILVIIMMLLFISPIFSQLRSNLYFYCILGTLLILNLIIYLFQREPR